MYCHICGKELSDQAKSCPECGMPVPETRENRIRKDMQPKQQASDVAAKPITTKIPPQPSPDDYPMKWYYYLRYAHLFMVAAGLCISGIISMVNEEILWGLIQIATAIYALVVRKALADYLTSAPLQIDLFFAIQFSSSIGYDMIKYLSLPSYMRSSDTGTTYIVSFVVTLIAGLILGTANATYFAKRKDLFTN